MAMLTVKMVEHDGKYTAVCQECGQASSAEVATKAEAKEWAIDHLDNAHE